MKRRDFLKSALAVGVLPDLANVKNTVVELVTTLPCIQVFTDQSTAQFRVLIPSATPITYSVVDSKGNASKVSFISRTKNQFDTKESIDHIMASGLNVDIDYTLVISETSSGTVLDRRTFRALDIDKAHGRMALVACMSDFSVLNRKDMWITLVNLRPEVILFSGDTCYADFNADGSAKDIWRRHFETRKRLAIFRMRRLTPILATFDDHDYGVDNADKTNPLKSVAHEVFEALFSSVARPGFTRGPGLSSKSNLFGQQIVLMDNRSFRDPVNAPNANLQWGTTQEDWLMNSIGNQANPAFVINGGQFFGAYLEKDSMEYETPNRLKQMIARLRDIQAPVMFGSGDVHFSELMRLERELLGYESYELTSSSIHSTNYKFANMRTNNSRRLASAWQHNFMMIETDASRASLGEIDMKVGCIGNGLLGVEGYFAKKLSIRR